METFWGRMVDANSVLMVIGLAGIAIGDIVAFILYMLGIIKP